MLAEEYFTDLITKRSSGNTPQHPAPNGSDGGRSEDGRRGLGKDESVVFLFAEAGF